MKMDLKKFSVVSAVFIIILGTILHFTYDWSGQNAVVGAFSAVNESTWEHLKLLYYPILITAIVRYFKFGKNIQSFWCGKAVQVGVSMMFTVIAFYTYTGVWGKDVAWLNIAIFILAAILGEIVNYMVIKRGKPCNKKVAIGVLVVLFVMFVSYTYNPPEIGLFKDPVSGGYGIRNKEEVYFE